MIERETYWKLHINNHMGMDYLTIT